MMNTLHRLCAASALTLGLCAGATAQSQGTQDVKNLQPLQSAAILAISAADTQALMSNFSSLRPRFTQNGGEALYQSTCQGCHMAKGEGAKGAGFYPALASNPKLAAAAYPASVVMNGLHGMPSFASKLSDEQIAEVVNYVRSSFGNQFTDKLTAADVKPFRITQ